MNWPTEPPEPEDLTDIRVSDPQGAVPVTLDIRLPTIEQVAGQIARQWIAGCGYDRKKAIEITVADAVEAMVNNKVSAIVEGVIGEALARPLRLTDGYGNPIGEPTTLERVLTARVENWAGANVNHEGLTVTRDSFHSQKMSRLEWMVGRIVGRELQDAVAKETKKIVESLKVSATAVIAQQIGLVLK